MLYLQTAAGAKETTTGVGFAGYTYMQDITKAKCDNIPVGTEGRLIDKRDNKVYWVARLKNAKDDNALCWMTQNLDYDGGSVSGYTGSDVVALSSGTYFAQTTINNKLYYDPGDYVHTKGASPTECSTTSMNSNTPLKNCTGWRRMSEYANELVDPSWTETDDNDFYTATSYISADGKMICSKEADSWLGDVTSDYIPCRIYNYYYVLDYYHYLLGNYYNWMAATAGTGVSSVTHTDVNGSICPTGWSLPKYATSSETLTGSFTTLAGQLNYLELARAPYYVIYGGYAYGSSLYKIGKTARYWTSKANVSDYAELWKVSFGSESWSTVEQSRYYGNSVRCVAR